MPRPVAERAAAGCVDGRFTARGGPAALERFYAHMLETGRAPQQARCADFAAVTTSRTGLIVLMKVLEASTRRYHSRPPGPCGRTGTGGSTPTTTRRRRQGASPRAWRCCPADWPAAWAAAEPLLDRRVRANGRRYRALAPKTRASIVQAVGLCAAARHWAAGQGVDLPETFSADLAEVFLRFLFRETGGDGIAPQARHHAHGGRLLRTRDPLRPAGRALHAGGRSALPRDPHRARLRGHRRDPDQARQDPPVPLAARALGPAARRPSLPRRSGGAAGAWRGRLPAAAQGHGVRAVAQRRRPPGRSFDLPHRPRDRAAAGRALERRLPPVQDPRPQGSRALLARSPAGSSISMCWPGGRIGCWRSVSRNSTGATSSGWRRAPSRPTTRRPCCRRSSRISGHLVRTLVTDLIRVHRPDAAWAAQALLGHKSQWMQATYRTDFRETAALDKYHGTIEALAAAAGRT